ncbi:MAG: recombinase family protein [Desulfopila sp.]|jgi:DNA invertase Pin-like site-specific DNA recombinase|nr:recombinase family protein [Desulfopila sp.]
MSVAGYVFLPEVDTEQAEIDRQITLLGQYAATQGMHLDQIYIETGSSVKHPFAERKEGREILRRCKFGDTLIAEHTTSVFASAREGLRLISTLRSKGVSLYCVDLDENISLPEKRKLVVSEGGAELVEKVLKVLAECEISQHGESIKAAKKKMKKEGRYLGGPVPFGWKVKDGALVRDKEQQRILREIIKMRADRWSYRDIAVRLKERFGLAFSHEGIRKIVLKNQ